MKFLVILLIIILAFLISLNNLLSYFKFRGSYELNKTNWTKMNVEERFGELDKLHFIFKMFTLIYNSKHNYISITLSLKTMLSGLFGIGEYVDTEFQNKDSSVKFQSAVVTENVCFFLYFMYRVVVIIFLLNMLVASMTQSYERISVNIILILILIIFFCSIKCNQIFIKKFTLLID